MILPTIAEFKLQFPRDFPYGTSEETVKDSDITIAISQASYSVNPELFGTQDLFTFAVNYLAAHYLVLNFKASSQGVGGSYSWLESGKSVGSVSQSFAIPENIMKHPLFAMYSKTQYGAYYLSLVLPLTYGQVGTVAGATSYE